MSNFDSGTVSQQGDEFNEQVSKTFNSFIAYAVGAF